MVTLIDIRSLSTKYVSGIPEYTKLLVDNLLTLDRKNEYILFANEFRPSRSLKKVSDKWRNYSNVRIVNFKIPNRFLDLSSRFFSFPRIDHLVKADIFYSPHLNILSFRQPQKHLLTIHDLSFIHYPEFFSLSRRLWHWRQAYRRQIKEAGKIIAVSDFTKADLIDSLGIAEEKITRIYPGVNPFYQVQSFTDQVKKPFLLYLGALEPRKNILALIKAFNIIKKKKEFSDLELIIVGAQGWLYDKIFKEARHSPWSDSIKFLGAVSNQELLRLYNLAQVFVYPSFFEGFGFPPLEAQACGLPVVASNRSSLSEVLGDSALLIDPHRLDELVMAIESLLTDNLLRDRLRERGLENVKRFQWNKAAEELLKVFDDFI